MPTNVDLELTKYKLVEKLRPSGWANYLKGFVQSSDFDQILKKLHTLRESGKRFTPVLKDAFKAFELCPVKDLRVVMVSDSPYPYMGDADGLALSCSGKKTQKTLESVLQAVETTVYQQWPTHQDPDLSRWASQGVLLLNVALTCQMDKANTHDHIWNDFIMYTIDMLNSTNSGLVFILMGEKAQQLSTLISPAHHQLFCTHPGEYRGTVTAWDCNNVFNETNRLIQGMNGPSFAIQW